MPRTMTSIPAHGYFYRNSQGKSSGNYCAFVRRLLQVGYACPDPLTQAFWYAGNMKTVVAVSALVRKEDQYLFIKQNKKGGAYPNTIHIPGGRLELNETPEEGVKREVEEETGVQIRNLQPVDFAWDTFEYKGEMTQFVFLRFSADWASGEALPSSDAQEVMWIKKSELAKQNHNPPSLSLLKKIGLI
jgi:8-oxo-dGTP diphosphatase